LAQRFEALLIDVDDDDRPLGRFARLNDLEDIECSDAKLFEGRGVGDTKAGKQQQQPNA
jgi:hypothetical protein